LEIPFSTFVTVTLAPAIGALFGSKTDPLKVAVETSACPNTEYAEINAVKIKAVIFQLVCFILS
jgi:hypothetical protein